jgi:hypothetical protein
MPAAAIAFWDSRFRGSFQRSDAQVRAAKRSRAEVRQRGWRYRGPAVSWSKPDAACDRLDLLIARAPPEIEGAASAGCVIIQHSRWHGDGWRIWSRGARSLANRYVVFARDRVARCRIDCYRARCQHATTDLLLTSSAPAAKYRCDGGGTARTRRYIIHGVPFQPGALRQVRPVRRRVIGAAGRAPADQGRSRCTGS